MKLNLSRAAKKLREEEKKVPTTPQSTAPVAPKRAKVKKPAPTPAPESVVPEHTPPQPKPVVEAVRAVVPAPEPPAGPAPKKVWPEKAKRPRFVREQTEKRERVTLPSLPPPSTRFTAKLMSRNLALPPKDEPPTPGRRPT